MHIYYFPLSSNLAEWVDKWVDGCMRGGGERGKEREQREGGMAQCVPGNSNWGVQVLHP